MDDVKGMLFIYVISILLVQSHLKSYLTETSEETGKFTIAITVVISNTQR
jgi:hypothetical protein